MEGEQIADPPSEKKSISQELVDWADYYMAMGVSFDEFWYGDPCRLKFYERRYFTGLEQENHRLWLQGYYDYMAFASVLAQMTQQRVSYPAKPIDLDAPTKSPKDLQQEAIKRMQTQLEAQRDAWIKSHKDE